MGKGKIAGNQDFLLFPQCSVPFLRELPSYEKLEPKKSLPAHALNLD